MSYVNLKIRHNPQVESVPIVYKLVGLIPGNLTTMILTLQNINDGAITCDRIPFKDLEEFTYKIAKGKYGEKVITGRITTRRNKGRRRRKWDFYLTESDLINYRKAMQAIG